MVVDKGYKQTDIGIIPEGWQLRSIDEVFDFYSTSNFSKAQMQLDGEVGCLHYGLIHAIPNSSYDLRNGVKYFVTQKQAKYELLKEGDVVMVDASEDLIGVNKSVEISGVRDELFIAGLHTFLLRDKGFYQPKFRGAILNSSISKTQMLRLAVGMKVFGVSKPQLKTILIPVPPLLEQTAIANALSDMDALIDKTEKLIEKKKAIKQGVMQELLKPKEGWVTKKLGEVISGFQNGYGFSASGYSNKGTPIVTMAQIGLDGSFNLDETKVNRWRIEDFNTLKNYHLVNGYLIIAMTDVTPEKNLIGRMAIVNSSEVLLLNQRVGLLRLNTQLVNPYFLMLLSNMKDWRSYCIASASLGVQANIGTKDILNGEMTLPNIETQNEISGIITELDIQIQLNKTKLTKLKHQKQGMMQALLTGKIRLI